jgi:type I restriction enzyme, R subunit
MFQEKDLEDLIVGLIKDKDYIYTHGDNLNRQQEEVILEDDLKEFLKKKYASNEITDNEIKRIIMGLTGVSINPLYGANKEVFKKIVNGEALIRDDRSKKDFHCSLIDFDDIENNIFRVCNQVIIKGPQQKRIPDTIIYINGLPMVVWEYKSTTKEDTTIHDAYTQITTRYTRDIPELFKYNAFVVISDGVNSKMGSLYADYEHFYAWRKVNEDDEAQDGIDSLYTMIDGLFTHERLLDVIHNFIFFPDDGVNDEIKIVCNYPQYFAATKLAKNVMEHKKPEGDGKGGTYFGTTGCGKSFGMLFLTRLLMQNTKLSSPTILLITDRTDLDEQLSGNFTIAREFINDEEVLEILSRDNLKEKLQGRASGGVYLTTIQKFTEDTSLLSDRYNIVCISDEAHRTQVNLDQKMKITKDGVKTTYGYAKYLHDSLPNATYIGFTGTPIDDTVDVFGEIVEKYTMKDSVKDGITVKLIYDGRLAKAVLDPERLTEIEEYYAKALEEGANEYQVEESKKKSVGVRTIMGDPKILDKVADCFIEHYENRVAEGSTVLGKAMFVAPDRPIAWDFMNIVKSKRPEWFVEKRVPDGIEITKEEKEKLKPMPMIRMVATRGKDDPEDMYEYLGTDEDRKEYAKQFKEEKSNFKIAVVVDMWLTGFDVQSLDTMYIDKLISQRHTIIQTISRVNRAYPGKESGLIVDFAGIKLGIDLALKKYSDYRDDSFDGIAQAIKIVKDEIDVLNGILHGFDSSLYFNGDNKQKLDTLNKAAEFVQSTKELENRFMSHARQMKRAFNLCNGSKDFSDKELDEIHYFCAIRSIIFKLTKGDAPDIDLMNKKVQEMVKNAIIADNAEEVFSVTRDISKNKIDLFSEEYLNRIASIDLPNTKVKILQQLLKQVIEDFKKVNKIKGVSFSERLQRIVDSYNNRTELADVTMIIDDTIDQLLNLAKELKEEQESFEGLGINYEEKAFYDVLISVEEKYNFDFPEDKNIELAKEINKLVSNKDKYADWLNRADIKAELQSDIIVLLDKHGFPALPEGTMEDYEKVYSDVIEQSENFRKYYNV